MMKSFVALISLLLLCGCYDNDQPLKLATSPWIGYEGIYQAKEFGWIDEKTELITGKIATETMTKLLNGEVDAATLTIDDVIIARSKGMDLKIIAVLDISSGADVILTKTKIKSFSDIRGKRIALDKSALGLLMLTKLLEKAHLQQHDVSIHFIPTDQQISAWENNQIDIAITYEPFASKLYDRGGQYLFSTHDFPETIFDVLVVRADKIKGRENTIHNLVKGHFTSLEYLNENNLDFIYRIASRQEISPDNVKRALGGVAFPSLAANRSYLTAHSPLMKSLDELNNLMSQKHFISQKVSFENIFDTNYVKEMK